jgi:ribosome-associated toxin RatA of RatAB toxin-antitoxin module
VKGSDDVAMLLRNIVSAITAGGRSRVRQSLATTALVLLAAAALPAASAPDPQVTVREEGGVYTVAASFAVAEPASTALAVLTDYEQIPRFMPDVRRSIVLEHGEGLMVVEQEAVARLMMFSKRIHLILEIQETPGVIRFRDRCGKSFARYEGGWTITEDDGHATIAYDLTATPSFDVPEFLLKRLFKRNAAQMIERLQIEMAARSHR